ncbi:hypothetical protein CHLNCDRAFT_137019 [Chlorella variabilis]|uniref:Uncharacterized protein n=1 Tax=Chlorella variabilis TaxID=554065 RepID=E1ZLT6_CHLVA|nr:hypothetical protein CHLNCDRAFT_137019 [Chlorella variabilis]EFN53320.1 hypothetical protein CHLNCDRAFT_137019 [Chlorella variabilis]|eukprot:XP_005845422.1 hypothetical protein CHLNCDRAFT_137019 [Chlorella variabilis]
MLVLHEVPGRRAVTRRRSAPARPSACDGLPDVLLARILALAGRGEWRTVTCVCKCWERLFFWEPSLWRTFDLVPPSDSPLHQGEEVERAWYAAQQRTLARVAAHVEVFTAGNPQYCMADPAQGAPDQRIVLEEFLALLQPGVLRQAELWWELVPDHAAALQPFRRLESLLLNQQNFMPEEVVAQWSQLPALRNLELHSSGLGEDEWEAILELTQLTRLAVETFHVITSGFSEQQAQLPQLTRLQHLRELAITHRPVVFYIEMAAYDQMDGGVVGVPSLSGFPSLQKYQFHLRPDHWIHWDFRVGGTSLSMCSYNGKGQLQIAYIRSLESLHQLVAALLPAGKPLPSLHLHSVLGCEPGALQGCTALAQVHSLLLVVARRGLEHLVLTNNNLHNIPPGPYLQDLRCLDLGNNSIATLPAALSAATSLTRLELDGNPALALSASDVDILSVLPYLRILVMKRDNTPTRVLRSLYRRMPALGFG